MVSLLDDPYIYNTTKEVSYLRSILNNLRSLKIEPNSDLVKVNMQQENILKTIRYDFAVKMTDLEQRIRKNTIRIFGLPETIGEEEDTVELVLDFFWRKLRVELNRCDINNSYRVGNPRGTYPRHVVVRFVSEMARKAVWKHRHVYRGPGMGIYEELCRERAKIFREAKCKFGKNSVFVENGVVQIRMPDGNSEKFLTLVHFRDFVKQRDFVAWKDWEKTMRAQNGIHWNPECDDCKKI